MGSAHSGIDDARNIARVLLALLHRGAVAAGPSSEVRPFPPQRVCLVTTEQLETGVPLPPSGFIYLWEQKIQGGGGGLRSPPAPAPLHLDEVQRDTFEFVRALSRPSRLKA